MTVGELGDWPTWILFCESVFCTTVECPGSFNVDPKPALFTNAVDDFLGSTSLSGVLSPLAVFAVSTSIELLGAISVGLWPAKESNRCERFFVREWFA